MTDSEPDRWTDVLGNELRIEALCVLGDVPGWPLTGPRLSAVEAAISAMSATLRKGDLAAFRAAMYALERAGPVRATGFGNTPTVELPQTVREQLNELIHTLDGRQAAEPEE